MKHIIALGLKRITQTVMQCNRFHIITSSHPFQQTFTLSKAQSILFSSAIRSVFDTIGK